MERLIKGDSVMDKDDFEKYMRDRSNKRLAGHFVPSNVYLMRCHKFYKVGFAENVGLRLSQVQVGNPYPVELVAICKTSLTRAKQLEKEIHSILKEQGLHVRGEWFELSDDYAIGVQNMFNLWAEHYQGWKQGMEFQGLEESKWPKIAEILNTK